MKGYARERVRRSIEVGAQKRGRMGEVKESGFPVRDTSADTLNLRENGRFVDQSGWPMWWEAAWGASIWGGG